MKVLKFGGTSVGSPERIKALKNLTVNDERKIVVLSAMSGTTNSLVEIINYLYDKNIDNATKAIDALEVKYNGVIDELFASAESKAKGAKLISERFDVIKSFLTETFTVVQERTILAQGELISTALFHYHLEEEGISSVLLPALDFMKINEDEIPDSEYIKENTAKAINDLPRTDLYITQGFICKNAYDEVDNLKRGGSDYTASLIGAAVNADEVQIWTDIDGIHNNDPRHVEGTKPIKELSFDEAAELAYFGAKILHPSTTLPCKVVDIPVRLKNTMQPTEHGTLITSEIKGEGIKAIAAKDGITAIKVKSGRMLLAYGFLRKVFEIFEVYKTPIDMITTSEVAVSVTIDNNKHLEEIVTELKKFGIVEVDTGQTIICIVGDQIGEKKGYARDIFDALIKIPIRMISYGGSRHNISILVGEDDKVSTLKALSEKLF